jgi:NTP pyrophosphatase (non-canonical NTP hydrolase)
MSQPNPDTLAALWASTIGLFERFGIQPAVGAQTGKLHEEVHEFLAELTDTPDHQRVAEELTDVLVVMLALHLATGGQLHHLTDAVSRVIAKNNAKSSATHDVADGQIRRRK